MRDFYDASKWRNFSDKNLWHKKANYSKFLCVSEHKKLIIFIFRNVQWDENEKTAILMLILWDVVIYIKVNLKTPCERAPERNTERLRSHIKIL